MTATREAIVKEALSWLGTPFHDCAGVKGHGVDCAHLLIRVFAAVGMIGDYDPHYKPQWFQHRDEPQFLLALVDHGAHQIEPATSQAGDVLMYSYGRHAAHGAIVVDDNTIIHAFKPVGEVCRGSRREMLSRLDSAWSLF